VRRTTNKVTAAAGKLRIEARGLTKSYGQLLANDGVTFHVETGEILGLVGENGAGKSTCMNMLFGHVAPDRGSVVVNGEELWFRSPREAIAAGIGMVHQHFLLAPALSALEHLELVAGGGIRERAMAHMKDLGFDVDLAARVEELPVGKQQQLEILKVICQGARVIILDEPTAVLTPVEVKPFLRCLERLRDSGHAVILISHKLDEVLQVCGRVVVMRGGRVTGEFDNSPGSNAVSMDSLAAAMMGEDVLRKEASRSRAVRTGESGTGEFMTGEFIPALVIDDYRRVAGRDALDLSLVVNRGEIVGIAGVEGNGQDALFRAILGLFPAGAAGFGARHRESGRIAISGRDVRGLRPRDIRRAARVALLPFDRRDEGLLLDEGSATNLLLSGVDPRSTGWTGWLLDWEKLRRHARDLFVKYGVSSSGIDAAVRLLSGGNQQKFLVARELEQNPDLVLAAHPTRGVDLRAARNIHDALFAARDRGAGVLLVTSDLDELCRLSDRVVVMLRGRIAREFTPATDGGFDIAGIGLAMTGGVRS